MGNKLTKLIEAVWEERGFTEMENGEEFACLFNDGVVVVSFIDHELKVFVILGEPLELAEYFTKGKLDYLSSKNHHNRTKLILRYAHNT